MAEVQSIVALLNAPPLNYAISLFDFCQKSPQQLRQVLLNVLSTIQPSIQRSDLDSEEATTSWVLELLRVLNYRPTIDGLSFKQGLASGSTDVYYPLLHWLLSQVGMLKKRAYLARFLVDVEIPPELLLEEDVNLLHAQYDVLRDHFKATHRHLESIRQNGRDPATLKEQVQALEVDRDHLHAKVAKVNAKLEDVDKVEEMLEVVGMLRGQTAEEALLIESSKEQKQALALYTVEHGKALGKLHHVQALASSESTTVLLQKMAQACSLLRYSARDKLPKELESKRLHLQALQDVLVHSNHSEDRLAGIQAKLLAVNGEVRALRRKNGQDHSDGQDDSKGSEVQRQQAQMGAIVANRIREAFDRLATLTYCRNELVAELDQKTRAIEEVKGSVRRGEDLKQYVELLRGKSITYKVLKKEMDDMAAEYGVLLRTQQLLERQAVDLPDLLDCNAFSGFAEEPSNPANMSGAFNEGEKSSKKVWKEISELDVSLREKRTRLSPLIKELKEVRTALQETEVEHSERKQHYNGVSALYERKSAKLDADVAASCREVDDVTNKLKDINSTIERLDVALDQLSQEKDGGGVSSKLSSKIQQQEELAVTFQQKQQKLKETEHANKAQMGMMKDLLTLLAAKLTIYSSGTRPAIYSTNSALETVTPQPSNDRPYTA